MFSNNFNSSLIVHRFKCFFFNVINNEINDIKQVLSEKVNTVDDKITKIKINEVVNQADSLKKGKVVSDKQVVSLMRYYQLIQEIDNVAKG